MMRRATRSGKQGRRASCLRVATAARGRVSRQLFMRLDDSAREGFGLGIILESRWRGQFREHQQITLTDHDGGVLRSLPVIEAAGFKKTDIQPQLTDAAFDAQGFLLSLSPTRGPQSCSVSGSSLPRTSSRGWFCGACRIPLSGSTHPFKYRLAYVVIEECVLRYDNEAGKGDHRHWGDKEFHYYFSNPETLLADFQRDIERWNHENGDS